MNNAKILVAIPYHKNKHYCIEKLLKRVQELSYKNIDVVMRWDLGEYGGKDNVKKQREYFRNIVINSPDYTHLFFLGVDTIPPKDVLERLLAQNKAIVGGVYWGRHDAGNGVPDGAVAWIHGKSLEKQRKVFLNMNNLFQISGMGMDCVLLRRDVLERVSWLSWEQNDDDYPYYDKAREEGYPCFIDTNIQCKHYFSKEGYTYLAKVHNK